MDMDARTRAALGESESGDPEVDELVDDIVETREEMTVTVEEIGDRLDPRNIVAGAKETVREATVGKVEDMANTAGALVSDAGDTVREAGSGIVDTITRNPIPAAMVGVGLGWLALSRRPSSQYGRDGWRPAYDRAPYGAATYDAGTYDAGTYDTATGYTAGTATGTTGTRYDTEVPVVGTYDPDTVQAEPLRDVYDERRS
jgi:hypothetical protein